ncbi:MAG TPA: hypothetical protein VIR77_00800 [Pontiella sp.]
MIEPTADATQEMVHPMACIPELILLAGGIIALFLVAMRFHRTRPDTDALTARL